MRCLVTYASEAVMSDRDIELYNERLVPVVDRARLGQLGTWDAVLALARVVIYTDKDGASRRNIFTCT